jgi:predicted DsbA family dithiol-disulfide isomerase
MAESGLDSLKHTRDITVEWHAFELRPGGQFPGTPEQEAAYRARIGDRHKQMQAHARQHFGLEMGEGAWAVNSRPALEGMFFARAQGMEDPYHRACFAAHWQEGRRLDDLDTLTDIARSIGLDAEAFQAAVEGGQHRVDFEMDLMLAREIGINAVPAFVFGNRYLVSGAQPVQVLEQVVDRCAAEGLMESGD